jgi:Astacin (Peptidase family M12A)
MKNLVQSVLVSSVVAMLVVPHIDARQDDPGAEDDRPIRILDPLETAPVIDAEALENYIPGPEACLSRGEGGADGEVLFQLPTSEVASLIPYVAQGGLAVAEGDIILGPLDNIQTRECNGDLCTVRTPLMVQNRSDMLWPGGVIFYRLDPDFDDVMLARIERALGFITSRTDLRFVERTNQSDFVDVQFVDRDVCNAAVGRQGGAQNLRLGASCWPNAIAHEFLHAAGFWHEHTRIDRDEYVRVIWENIRAGECHNFVSRADQGTHLGPYDYQSIMHYRLRDFGRENENGRPMRTLEILRPNLPQRNIDGLSRHDVRGIQRVYGERDCIRYDPDSVEAQRQANGMWLLVGETRSGNAALHNFSIDGEAAVRGAGIVQAYGADRYCHVLRGSGFTYLLVDDELPSRPLEGEDCMPIRPDSIAVESRNDLWMVTAAFGSDGRRRTIHSFDEPGWAYRLAELIDRRGARFTCHGNRGNHSFEYLRR